MKKNEKEKHVPALFDIAEWEVKWTIFTVAMVFVVFICIDFYNEFFLYEEAIKDIAGDILGALIGLLGFALSGIAIIVSLFSTKEAKMIDRLNGEGKIVEILESYSLLAKNIGVQCFVLLAIYFALVSNQMLVCKTIFYVILLAEIYHIVFIILYTVALIKNCIELWEIKNIYARIEETEKSIHDTVNEVKIDFIFSTLINNYGCTKNEVISRLVEFIDESQLENKEKIVDYVKKQYEE